MTAEIYVYVMGMPGGRPQKIGLAKNPFRRAKAVRRQRPHPVEVSFYTPVLRSEAYAIERLIHQRSSQSALGHEWFDIDANAGRDAVETGIQAFRDGHRPLASAPERLAFNMTKAILARVEEWRRAQERIPSRSEAIRLLVDQALSAKNAKRT